jgi:hypothetical protein
MHHSYLIKMIVAQGLFNFKPSVRPVPLECHIQGFPGKFYCPRMATMNKPAYAAIQVHDQLPPGVDRSSCTCFLLHLLPCIACISFPTVLHLWQWNPFATHAVMTMRLL